MSAGGLDQQIFFQSPAESNFHGEIQTVWTPDENDSPGPAVEWADVIKERGTEAFESARSNAVEIVRVKIRFRDDVQTGWRFRWNDRMYYVSATDHTERRQGWLWITAKAQGVK